MKQSQTHKPAKKGWRKSGAAPVNTCYKSRQPVSGVAKIGKYCGNTKNRGKTGKYTIKCAPTTETNSAISQEKAKIAAQRREKRIKTTIDKAPGRHSIYRIANSNPKKKSSKPTNRGNCGAEHIRHNKTNKNGCKQKTLYDKTNHISAGCRAEGFSQTADTLSNGRNALPKKRSTPASGPADSTNQAEQKQQNKPY